MATLDARPALLPDIIRLHGKWRAAKPALVSSGHTLTWAELDRRSNRIANLLRTANCGPGGRLGIVMQNGPAMVLSLIAAMKAGCASVPINLSVSDVALDAMLTDAGVDAVIATPEEAARVDTACGAAGFHKFIAEGARSGWDDLEAATATQTAEPPAAAIAPDDAFNIIYSSGTTGRPKGILHTHGGRRDWAYDLALALRYDTQSRTLFNIGLYSNISWVGFLATLLVGGTLYVEGGFDARETLALMAREKITNASMVPIQYQRLLDVPDQADFDLSGLRAVMSCGSPLHGELKAALFKRLGPKLIELYGLTEGLITTLDPEEADGRLASVGKPLPGTDIRIIDEDGHELPFGATGEIVGTGRFVMPGYLNRPDATAEATWRGPDGRNWLRTGDIGRLDADGYLYIVDRRKDMILSGGQNIYPQDIEAVLKTHPDIADVAVIGVGSRRWGETPLALVVRRDDGTADADTLLAWANGRLGRQQRIAGLDFVSDLPRNPNGKILKRHLRERYKDRCYD